MGGATKAVTPVAVTIRTSPIINVESTIAQGLDVSWMSDAWFDSNLNMLNKVTTITISQKKASPAKVNDEERLNSSALNVIETAHRREAIRKEFLNERSLVTNRCVAAKNKAKDMRGK